MSGELFVYHRVVSRLVMLAFALSLVACTQGGDPWYTTTGTADAGGGDAGAADGGGGDAGGPGAAIDPTILQIFDDNKCMNCHGGPSTLGGLDISTLDGLLAGGTKAGAAIIPCDAAASPLIQVLDGGIDDGTINVAAMPLGGDPIGSEDTAALAAWIDAGAGVQACDGDGEPGDPDPTLWTDGVRPALEPYCSGCHGAAGFTSVNFLGDEAILDGDATNSYGSCDGLSVSACILVVLEEGTMPQGGGCDTDPAAEGCPTEAEITLVRNWVDAGAPH